MDEYGFTENFGNTEQVTAELDYIDAEDFEVEPILAGDNITIESDEQIYTAESLALETVPPEVQEAQAFDAVIRKLDHTMRESFVKLGITLNEFEAKSHFEHLGFADMQDYMRDALGSRVNVARGAMRITAQLNLPFDAMCKLNRDSLELMLRLPEKERSKDKWNELAEQVASGEMNEHDFEREVRAHITDIAEDQHIELPRVLRYKVAESVGKLFEEALDMARSLNIADGDGAGTEKAIERLAHDYVTIHGARYAEIKRSEKALEAVVDIRKGRKDTRRAPRAPEPKQTDLAAGLNEPSEPLEEDFEDVIEREAAEAQKWVTDKTAERLNMNPKSETPIDTAICYGCNREFDDSKGIYWQDDMAYCSKKCIQERAKREAEKHKPKANKATSFNPDDFANTVDVAPVLNAEVKKFDDNVKAERKPRRTRRQIITPAKEMLEDVVAKFAKPKDKKKSKAKKSKKVVVRKGGRR